MKQPKLLVTILAAVLLAGILSFVAAGSALALDHTFVVDSTGDGVDSNTGDGVCDDGTAGTATCTLRAAIEEANANAAADTIVFNIPGVGGRTIALGSVLPLITRSLTIDGSNQLGVDGVPLIDIDAFLIPDPPGGFNSTMQVNRVAGLTLKNFKISNSHRNAVRISNTDNVLVEKLYISDATAAFAHDSGLVVTGCVNITVQDLTVSDMDNGISVSNCSGDVQVLNNDLSNSGTGYALDLVGLAVTGLDVSGNKFHGSIRGVTLENMSGLTISNDRSMFPLSQIVLEDWSGLTTTQRNALSLRAIDDSLVTNLDLSGDPTAPASTFSNLALGMVSSNNTTIQYVNAKNRKQGIVIVGGSNIRVLNNNLSNSSDLALIIRDFTDGIDVRGNTFRGSKNGIFLRNLSGLTISNDRLVFPDSQIILESTSGIDEISRIALELQNVDNAIVTSVDLSNAAGAFPAQGVALRVRDSDNLTVRDVTATYRSAGFAFVGVVDPSSYLRVFSNDLSNARSVALGITGMPAAGLEVSGNIFTGSQNAVSLDDMSGLTISDGSVENSQVVLDATSDLGSTVVPLILFDIDDSTVDGINLTNAAAPGSGTGMKATFSDDLTIRNVTAADRHTGFEFRASNVTVSCTSILNNGVFGVIFYNNGPNSVLFDNHIEGNGEGIRNQEVGGSPGPLVLAENNFWGAADGPTNLGGSGDSFVGNVDADPFLSGLPACLGGSSNTPPVVGVAAATATVDEGLVAAISGTFSDADGDPVALTASVGAVTDTGAGTWSWSFTTSDGPAESQTVTISADDGNRGTASVDFDLVVNNVAPNVGPIVVSVARVNVNTEMSVRAAFSDPAETADETYTCTVDYGGGTGPQAGTVSGTACTGPEQRYTRPGNYEVTIVVTDKDGGEGLAAVIIPVDTPPVVVANHTSVGADEGQAAANSGTVGDADGDTVTLTASVGAVANNGDGTWSWSFTTSDGPGESQTVTIDADDGNGGTASIDFALAVDNVAPTVGLVAIPTDPVNINAGPVTASAVFSDPAGAADAPFTCTVDYGDGAGPQVGTVVGTTCTGPAQVYAGTGVYEVTVAVTDKDGGTVSVPAAQFLVIYDPEGGFVTGGGWIDSPAGAYAVDPSLTGKATFGFVSKYKKGATVPTGRTQFRFKAGDLNFQSSSYEWLVIAGARAQFKGVGAINGTGNYGFMLTAIDGTQPGGGGSDKFRIKIWDLDNGAGVVYDNQPGAGQGDNPTTALGGGNIVIHAE